MERMLKKSRPLEMLKVDKLTSSLIQELMNAATSFHKLHLQITGEGSYAAHKALNELYDSLPNLADSIAEGYQGACEIILQYQSQGPVILSSIEDALNYMRQIKMQINELQKVMHHTEIINLLDTVKDSINSAKYKLIFLK
jgi:DNA-binding ferritin-like protein